jgi:DnaJ-class molecular chaperone
VNQIFTRLERLIRSWNLPDSSDDYRTSQDPYLREAEDELEAYLNPKPEIRSSKSQDEEKNTPPKFQKVYPYEIIKAYDTLNLVLGSSWEEINDSHKKLLKRYHPDRFAADPKAYQEATEASKIINQAYQVLKKYFGR